MKLTIQDKIAIKKHDLLLLIHKEINKASKNIKAEICLIKQQVRVVNSFYLLDDAMINILVSLAKLVKNKGYRLLFFASSDFKMIFWIVL